VRHGGKVPERSKVWEMRKIFFSGVIAAEALWYSCESRGDVVWVKILKSKSCVSWTALRVVFSGKGPAVSFAD